MHCKLHGFHPKHLQLSAVKGRHQEKWGFSVIDRSSEWHRELLNSDGCQFLPRVTAANSQLSFFTGTLNKYTRAFLLGQQNLQPDLSWKSLFTYRTVLMQCSDFPRNAVATEKRWLDRAGTASKEMTIFWHFLCFHGSLGRTPCWFQRQQDHEDRQFIYLADKNMILALLSHRSQEHFLVLSEAFQAPFGARWAFLHYHCLSEVLKNLPVCKYLQLWVYTRRGDASRLLSVFLWQKYSTELVTFWKVFKA